MLIAIAIGMLVSVSKTAPMPSDEEAYKLVTDALCKMAGRNSLVAGEIRDKAEITVNSVGQDGTGCVINITVKSPDVVPLLKAHIDDITALDEPDKDGNVLKSDEQKTKICDMVAEWLPESETVENTVDVICGDVDGSWQVYCSEELADTVFPGVRDFKEEIAGTENKALKRLNTLTEVKTDEKEPDTRNWIQRTCDDLKDQFILNFVTEHRWMMIVNGLGTTLEITGVSLVIGILVGIVVAAVRSSFDKNRESLEKRGGLGYTLLSFFNGVCKLYVTVIRGTPVVVQVLIYYFIIFTSVKNGTLVAMLAFGLNSGAYVAEIFRGGIMSVDNGQFEAGRSIGLDYTQTMIYVVIPQVFKSVLPTLCNEFIALLKETSIVGYVGEVDLTKAGDLIRGRTFSAFMPLIAVALIYLAMVVLLTWLVGRLEKRLRKNER